MAQNTAPIFTQVPKIQWIDAVLTANTTKDLTSGTSYLVFTADATDGSYLSHLRVQPKGSNIATVMRVWINNGSTTATAANNTYFAQVTIALTTNIENGAIQEVIIPMNIALPAGYRIYVTLGTGVAAGFHVCGVGGDY